jgi:hypothetical protein
MTAVPPRGAAEQGATGWPSSVVAASFTAFVVSLISFVTIWVWLGFPLVELMITSVDAV